MRPKFIFLFTIILLFSFVIRLYHLTQNPEGFDQTEAAFGYNAYSILKTGRDEYGKLLPLILVSIGDYKLSGYSYWQIPFIQIFGLNEYSTRLSTATAGLISLLLIYFIVSNVLKSKKIALLTFFFTSITPWHLVLSRIAYDPIVALMFYLFSITFFILWYKRRRFYKMILSMIFLSLSILTYYAFWVVFPFTLILFWLFIYKKIEKKIQLLYLSLVLLLPILVLLKLLITTQGQRLYQDSTYQVHAFPLLKEQITEDQLQFPNIITRLFHNKVIFYPQFLLQNLSNNLSFDFLFLRGDRLDRRFYVPYNGVLLLWMAPFVLLGILNLWKNHSLWENLLIYFFIIVIFLASSFSELGSESERTLLACVIFSYFTAYGLVTFYNLLFKHSLSLLILGCLCFLLWLNLAYFNHQYYWHANVHQPWGRDYGVPEMIFYLRQFKSRYKKIIIPDSAYIFIYFYNQTNPKISWEESANMHDKANYLGLNLRTKAEEYLTMPIDCPAAGKLNILYVCKGAEIPKNSKIIKSIRYRDNQPAFTLLEFIPEVIKTSPPENIKFMDKYGIISEEDERYWKEEKDLP